MLTDNTQQLWTKTARYEPFYDRKMLNGVSVESVRVEVVSQSVCSVLREGWPGIRSATLPDPLLKVQFLTDFLINKPHRDG